MAHSRRNEIEDQLSLLVESSDDESDTELSDSDDEMEDLSDDENVGENGFDKIQWTDGVKNDLLTPDKELVFDSGPVHDLPPGSTPLQYLKLLFTDDVCEAFQLNINKYAELEQKRKKSTDTHWKPIDDIQELWRFFSILLIRGIVRLPKLKHYWSNNDILGNKAVKILMSRNRFQKILHYFQIAGGDIKESGNCGTFDFTQTLEPIMNGMKERFLKHFKPPRELLVNGAFIKNKADMGVLQYMPSRSGLKIWTLSSPAGYVFNFDLYIGKKSKESKNGIGHDVVSRLLLPIESKGHQIYLDRFFSSVPFMIELYKDGNRACGSIKIDRKYMPKELKTLKLEKFGDCRYFQCVQCPDLLCCAWYDNEQHCVLSTNSKLESVEVKIRQGNHMVPVQCPSMVDNYYTHMRYLEKSLRTRNYCNRLGRSSKWWRYLFWFLFDSCLNNAFIVYSLTNMPKNQRSKKFLDFKLDVIEEILNNTVTNSLRNRSLNVQSSTAESSNKSESSSAPSSTFLHQKVRIKGEKSLARDAAN